MTPLTACPPRLPGVARRRSRSIPDANAAKLQPAHSVSRFAPTTVPAGSEHGKDTADAPFGADGVAGPEPNAMKLFDRLQEAGVDNGLEGVSSDARRGFRRSGAPDGSVVRSPAGTTGAGGDFACRRFMNPERSAMRPATCSNWSPISSDIRNLRPSASPPASASARASCRVEILIADMEVGYGSIRARFATRDRLDREKGAISIVNLSGPFKHFELSWTFRDLPTGGSRIVFSTRYQFSNPALEFLFSRVFASVFSGLTRAFELRANQMAKASSPVQKAPDPPDGP